MSDTHKWGTWYPIPKSGFEGLPPIKVPVLLQVDVTEGHGSDKPGAIQHVVGYHLATTANRPSWWADAMSSGDSLGGGWGTPTHWMPLPPSPEEMAARPSLEKLVIAAANYQAERDWDQCPEAEALWDCLSGLLSEAGAV